MTKIKTKYNKVRSFLAIITVIMFVLAVGVIIRGPIGTPQGRVPHRLVAHAEPPKLFVTFFNTNLRMMESLEFPTEIYLQKDMSNPRMKQEMEDQHNLERESEASSHTALPSRSPWDIWPSLDLFLGEDISELTEQEISIHHSLQNAANKGEFQLREWARFFDTHSKSDTGVKIGNEIGTRLRRIRKYEQAEQWYRKVLPAVTEDWTKCAVRINLALVCLGQQKFDEAQILLNAVKSASVAREGDEYFEGLRCIATGIMGTMSLSGVSQIEARLLFSEEIKHGKLLMKKFPNNTYPGLYTAMIYTWKLGFLQQHGLINEGMKLQANLIGGVPLNRWTAKSHQYCRTLLKRWQENLASTHPMTGREEENVKKL